MENEINLSSLEHSLEIKPNDSSRYMIAKNNAYPINELKDFDFEINLLKGNNFDKRIDISQMCK